MRESCASDDDNFFVAVINIVCGTVLGVLHEMLDGLTVAEPAARRKRHGPRRRRRYPEASRVASCKITHEKTTMEIRVSRSPQAYQQRRGLLASESLPQPRVNLKTNLVNALPLAAPYPTPAVVRPVLRPASPDAGTIGPWPPVGA